MTKLLSFAAGVLATVLFLGVRSWLAGDRDAPLDGLATSSPAHAEPAARETTAALVRPEQAPPPRVEREPVVSREALERELFERIAADLPDGWVVPLDPTWEADGPRLGDLPHGEWTILYPDSGLTEVGRFVLGARQGTWKAHDADGKPWQSCTYVNGLRDGTLEQYQPYGSWEYRRGELVQ